MLNRILLVVIFFDDDRTRKKQKFKNLMTIVGTKMFKFDDRKESKLSTLRQRSANVHLYKNNV